MKPIIKNSDQIHIRPFVEIGHYSKYPLEKRLGFDITHLHLDRTKEGWLRLYCKWNQSKKAFGRTKHPVSGCVSSTVGTSQEIELNFPEIKSTQKKTGKSENYPASFTVGIQLVDSNGEQYFGNEARLEYSYKFVENIGYGVLVWFAPKDWNDGRNEEVLFEYNK